MNNVNHDKINLPLRLLNELNERKANFKLRNLSVQKDGIDFISNDYLGFSKLGLLHQQFIESFSDQNFLSGSGGSRLISGNSEFKELTEKEIALFHHAEAALLFNSGYDANIGLLSSIPQKNDLVISDELIHASIYDGIRLSYAKHYKFTHNKVDDLEDLIERHKNSFDNIYVVVESIYSMDGDAAPLKEIVNLIEKHQNVYLIVDEAHAIGVFGKNGKGLCNALQIEDKCFARVYTFGKAMGCHGAVIVGSEVVRNYLINFARSFIYTTALPDYSIANIAAAYQLLVNETQQEKLKGNINYFLQEAKHLTSLIKSESAIQCIIVKGNKNVTEIEKQLLNNGILVKAVKSPTVKEGSERIRVCLHSFNTKEEINNLISLLQ